MSSAFSRPGRRLAPLDGQDIVFCHNCGHEWYRSARDTSPPPPCPRCEDEFVELVSRDNDPRAFQQTVLPSFADALLGLGALGGPAHSQLHHHMHDDADLNDDDDADDFDHDLLHDQLHNHIHDHIHSHAHAHGHPHEHLHDALEDSDPEEADIEEQEFHGPNNIYMYRTISTFQTGGRPRQHGAGGVPGMPQPPQPQHHQPPPQPQQQPPPGAARRPGLTDPTDAEAMINTFTQFLNGFRDGQAGRSGPETLFFSSGGRQGAFEQPTRRTTNANFGATSFTIATGPLRPRGAGEAGGGGGDFNTVFGNIMGNVGPPNLEEQNRRAAGLPPGFPAALHHILAALLSRDTGVVAYGDAVHSEEALDRIISMLMENNQAAAGAPPASQTALDQLERKKVDAKMLGPEGHAECTICISEVQLSEQVLSLPCKHWFHEECVVMWLKQHNTCPVCRNPVVASSGSGAEQPADGAAAAGEAAANGGTADSGGNGNGSNINLPRRFFSVNIGGPGDFGSANSASSSSNPATARATGAAPNAAAASSPSSSSSSAPHLANLRQRIHTNQERLNAIRSAAGLPPAMMGMAASTANTSANSPNSTHSANSTHHYRSSRVPERSAAAERERERRRRNSHSPNPGLNFPSRRYNIPTDYDDWFGPLDDSPSSSTSRSRHRSPSSHSASHYHWWSSVGAGGNGGGGVSGNGNGSGGAGSGAGAGSSSDQRGWDPLRDHRSARDRGRTGSDRESTRGRTPATPTPTPASGGGLGGGGSGHPSLSRTSTRHSRSSMYSSDPAPDAGAPGRSFPPSWLPSSYNMHFGGDGHGDPHSDGNSGHGDPNGGSHHNNNSSNNNNNGNGNANGNGNGNGNGGGGFFNFFRGLARDSGSGHPSANARRRP